MSDSKKSAWDNYRRWRLAMWIFMMILVVVISIPSLISNGLVTLLAFTPAIICLFSMKWFKCPRCGDTFFHESIWWYPWVKACLHCGLPKWETADYVNPDSERASLRYLSIAEMATAPANSVRERNSRFLICILRDDPGAIHLPVDSEGWAEINNLLTRANRYGFKLNHEDITEILTEFNNNLFEPDPTGKKIRWRKG